MKVRNRLEKAKPAPCSEGFCCVSDDEEKAKKIFCGKHESAFSFEFETSLVPGAGAPPISLFQSQRNRMMSEHA